MKKRKLTQEEIKKYSFKTHLEEAFKDPEFKRGFKEESRRFKLGYRIFCAREDAGITQQELARKIGTRQSNISRLEKGEYNFTVEMLQKLANALGLELRIELLGLSKTKAA